MNGTFYSAEALDGAILALEYARVNKIRIRIFYAYKAAEEKERGVKDSEFDVMEVPILLSSASCYGSPILDSRTVLVKTKEYTEECIFNIGGNTGGLEEGDIPRADNLDFRLKRVKYMKDGRQRSKIIMLLYGWEKVKEA